MKVRVGIACILLFAASPALTADLALKRVLLSTGGVGYFEHEAVVEGDAELTLDLRLDQIDDVLKSIVVYDDAGNVGGVGLPGREPLSQTFRDLPFGRGELNSPVTLLNALQGAEITVAGPQPLSGRVLRAVPEQVVLPDGRNIVIRHRVSVITATGLRQFVLEQAEAVSFADPELQAQVNLALAALAEHRAQDRRRLTVTSRGQGRRTVRVGYVVGAPLWKSSYRLTLPNEPTAETALLQGWAVIENLSGQDWEDVELTLASGNPVTFRQALYQAYFVSRPEVPVEVIGRILPPPADTGAIRRLEMAEEEDRKRALKSQAGPRRMMSTDEAVGAANLMMAAPSTPATAAVAARTDEATTQVLFRFAEPVSVQAGRSLALPIADRTVPAAQVAFYQPATDQRRLLASVELTNDGDSGLPPGVLTIYQRDAAGSVAYVGDARLAPLPVDETRLLSYAVDEKTRIDREDKSSQQISTGAISDGVLRLKRIDRMETVYTVTAPAREARRVILSHPRQPGWRLMKPPASDVDVTENTYRLTASLAAGATRSLTVVTERPRSETIRLLTLDIRRLGLYARAQQLDPKLRNAFAEMVALKRVIDTAEKRLVDLREERTEIVADQDRIRDNLARVPRESDIYRRYLAKLNDQEDELERLAPEIDAAEADVDAAERGLRDYIDGLKI